MIRRTWLLKPSARPLLIFSRIAASIPSRCLRMVVAVLTNASMRERLALLIQPIDRTTDGHAGVSSPVAVAGPVPRQATFERSCVMVSEDPVRDIGAIRLARWGRIAPSGGVPPFDVVDPDGRPVEPIRRLLRAIGVGWDKATSAEVRDFVLWIKQARKARSAPRRRSAATAGTVNPVTRKRYQDDQYMATTVRHSNAVLRTFYLTFRTSQRRYPPPLTVPSPRGLVVWGRLRMPLWCRCAGLVGLPWGCVGLVGGCRVTGGGFGGRGGATGWA